MAQNDVATTETRKAPLVLIADDMPRNLQVLGNTLKLDGYRVAIATNGYQTIDIAKSARPDLILLDVMMPDMDGFETCKRLKSDPDTEDIPIIFLTGKTDKDDVVRGFETGAVDYVTKPFNSAELLNRVRTQVELKISRDDLLDANRQLENMREELQKLNASKDKFFSIVAHDLRGPFTGFLGLSEIMAENGEKMPKEDMVKYSVKMHEAAENLFTFLENLLTWSRSQMGRIEYRPQDIDLTKALRQIASLYRGNADKKKLDLLIDIPEGLCAYADEQILATVLRNMIANSVKFTPEGGLITVSTEDDSPERLRIKVSDTGIGMKPETIEKVFRLDTKYSTPGTQGEPGTGLGLMLCKDLIEHNGGEIRVLSESGKGTELSFTVKKQADGSL